MFLPEPVTLIVFGSWLLGDAVEGGKWKDSNDPNPRIYYAYDPGYFKLGDEGQCGDETNGPCKGGFQTVAAEVSDPSLGSMGCESCDVAPAA